MARAPSPCRGERDPRTPLARARPGRPGRPRRDDALDVGCRVGHRLPAVDDLRGRARPARPARVGGGVGTAPHVARVRPALHPGGREARRAHGNGHDGAPGWLRRARQHHRRPPVERRRARGRVRADRPQVVLLRTDVRRVPGAGSGRRRALVLPAPALDAGRRAQRLPHPTAEGQARQPLECVERGRVRRRLGAARRRGGPRGPDDHRDGQLHTAGLRAGVGGAHARRRGAGHAPHRPPVRVRQAAR